MLGLLAVPQAILLRLARERAKHDFSSRSFSHGSFEEERKLHRAQS